MKRQCFPSKRRSSERYIFPYAVSFLLITQTARGGYFPDRINNTSADCLRAENPDLWDLLGLPSDNPELVMNLEYNHDQMLKCMLEMIISLLCDLGAGKHCSPEGKTKKEPWTTSPESGQLPGTVVIDFSTIPARWLLIREVRQVLLRSNVAIDKPENMAKIRRLENLWFPAEIAWNNVVLENFSFKGSVICRNHFKSCKLVKNNLKEAVFYQCIFRNCQAVSLDSDHHTKIQTCMFQGCEDTVTQKEIQRCIPYIIPDSGQRLSDLVLNALFLYRSSVKNTASSIRVRLKNRQNVVRQFCDQYQLLYNDQPETLFVTLQAIYIFELWEVAESGGDLSDLQENMERLRELMSDYHENSLLRIHGRKQQLINTSSYVSLLSVVEWPAPALSSRELLVRQYKINLETYLHNHNYEIEDTPGDHQCFYHCLARHIRNDEVKNHPLYMQAQILRQVLAGFIFYYLSLEGLPDTLSYDDSFQAKAAVMNQLADSISLEGLLSVYEETASLTGWAGQELAAIAAIALGQPLYIIVPHGNLVQLSLTCPDGTIFQGEAAEHKAGESEDVIGVVFDGVNHWQTLVGGNLFQADTVFPDIN